MSIYMYYEFIFKIIRIGMLCNIVQILYNQGSQVNPKIVQIELFFF